MEKPLIRVGRYYFNIHQIAYVITDADAVRVVTTAFRPDGKNYSVSARGVAAQAIRAALEPYVNFDSDGTEVDEI